MRFLWASVLAVALAGCGGGTYVASKPSATQALTSSAELLELESPNARQEMFRELARISMIQAGKPATGPVLFPIVSNGEVVSAPGFDGRFDLLQAPDAGSVLELVFDRRAGWAEDRRDSLQGLSEREAAELVARTLLAHWAIQPSGPVVVDRAAQAPYAAAYVDGILRINPAFVYMAASSVGPSLHAPLQ